MPIDDSGNLTFRKSSYCNNGNCLEVAPTAQGVALRDNKNMTGPVLFFSAQEWSDFVGSVKLG